MMVVRKMDGGFNVVDGAGLLAFLDKSNKEQVISNKGRSVKVAGDVEVIAAAAFCLGADSGDNASNGIPWTFSTFDIDRYDERIDPAGWDCKAFMKNPVVQWAHRFDIPAIGRAENITVDDTGLHGSIVFNDKAFDEFGWSIGERVKAGVIRAGSVGFRPLEIEIPDEETAKDGTALIFRKQELLEFSICNVPANAWALAEKNFNSEHGAIFTPPPAPHARGGGKDFFGGFFGH
jgi:HK97 family phage prohead protease